MIGKTLGYAVIIAVMGFAAQAEEVGGVIASFDEESRAIMLDDGKTYLLGEDLDATNVVAGTKVVLDYDMDGDRMIVKQIRAQ